MFCLRIRHVEQVKTIEDLKLPWILVVSLRHSSVINVTISYEEYMGTGDHMIRLSITWILAGFLMSQLNYTVPNVDRTCSPTS